MSGRALCDFDAVEVAAVSRHFGRRRALWLSIAAGIWWASLAFHIEMPYTGSFPMVALLVVGVGRWLSRRTLRQA